MKSIGRVFVCIGVLVAFVTVLPAATIINETFESYSTVGNIQVYDTSSWFGSGEVTAGSVDLLNNYGESETVRMYCHSGLKCLDMDGSTDLEGQLTYWFSYAGGVEYTLSFWVAPSGRATTESLAVNFAGVTTTVDTPAQTGGVAVSDWTQVLMTFTPVSSGSGSIVFTQGVGSLPTGPVPGDNVGLLLDDIHLTSNAVPEPGTLALLAGGLALAGLLRRRKA